MSDPNPHVSDAPPPAPAAPAPAKPAPAKAAAKGKTERRSVLMGILLSPMVWAWGSLTAAAGVLTLGTVRFLFPNVLAEPPSKVKAGFPDSYEDGKVVDK